MLNLFVLDVLKAFLPEEKEEFRIFLSSPYFNRGANREPLMALLNIVLDAQEKGTIDALEKDTIFEMLYPNKPLVESKVDKLISELKRQVQDFLTTRRYHAPQNEALKILDFSIELRQKGLDARYHQTLEKLKKETDNQEWETVEHYFIRHLIAMEEHEWHSTFNKAKGDVNIPDAIHHLDNYYWALKTEMLNRLLLQHKMTALSPDAIKAVEENWVFPNRDSENSTLISVIWGIYQLLKDPKPQATLFFKLMDTLKTNENKFSPENLTEFYTYLRNICGFLIEAGNTDLVPVLHQIQRDNLQRGYFYFEGKIAPNAYLSFTQTALRVQEIDWVKSFVENHKDRIHDENETHDFYCLNKALYLFAEKKYDTALDIIPFGSTYSLYHLLARRLELKIYYELDSDLLPYKIDAFKMFISRAGSKVLSESLHELQTNFINFLRQLSLSPTTRDKSRAEKMVQRINEKKLVAERAWLLEKARELGSGKK